VPREAAIPSRQPLTSQVESAVETHPKSSSPNGETESLSLRPLGPQLYFASVDAMTMFRMLRISRRDGFIKRIPTGQDRSSPKMPVLSQDKLAGVINLQHRHPHQDSQREI